MEQDKSLFENAAVMVDMCRFEYERLGFDSEMLRGMEITDTASAELAMMLIDALPKLGSTASLRQYTLETLGAVTKQELLAAS